jgi:hypothetical protein
MALSLTSYCNVRQEEGGRREREEGRGERGERRGERGEGRGERGEDRGEGRGERGEVRRWLPIPASSWPCWGHSRSCWHPCLRC